MPPLTKKTGNNTYWRSANQLEDTPEFREWIEREFPEGASELSDPVSRRQFLTVMGASLALAGLTGCRRPVEKIVPFVKAPEEQVLGVPVYYASALPRGTGAIGVVIETNEGRPTKVEGNELHPYSLGGTDLQTQAEILNLYDPDRETLFTDGGALRSWDDFVAWWRRQSLSLSKSRGEGLAVLTGSFSSPTLARLKKTFAKTYPRARFINYDAVSDENRDAGIAAATGRPMQPVYALEKADIIVSLDMDFVQTEADAVLHARQFADGRRVMSPDDSMNRLYIIEGVHSTTGSIADHRLHIPTRRIGAFAAALALELEKHGLTIAGSDALAPYAVHDFNPKWLEAAAKDLVEHKGRSLVLAGRRQPAGVHALVYAINAALLNLGKTVSYRSYGDAARSYGAAVRWLADEMRAGKIKTLLMVGVNPVYDAPADARFAEALQKVENTVLMTMHTSETGTRSRWVLSQTHPFEQWGDVRAADGSVSVIQPTIEPLFKSKSDVELFGLLATGEDKRGYEWVRETWDAGLVHEEDAWRRVLHDGILAGSRSRTSAPPPNSRAISAELNNNPFPLDAPTLQNLELVFRESAKLFDGRYANNSWLMEVPDPVSKVAWENVALISSATAKALRVKQNEGLRIISGGVTLELPAVVVPGMVDNSIVLELGYGREGIGRIADGAGVNVYPMRTADFVIGATAVPTGTIHKVANTQDHNAMEGRPLIREATLETYRESPKFAQEMVHMPDLHSLWKDWTWSEGYQWGLVVDLNVCTGCNACVVACQSENNVPVVGQKQVRNGREMHWLRLDRYYVGDAEDARMVNQPVMCQQCEMAPCEQVCPVNATVHDSEGLNMMTYNRCIGTRYCSNNCPYKVRRFNFFNYTNEYPELLKLAQNPEVTIRSRGVMEKCSYCLQRINRAKFQAKTENRQVRDGELKTACQQACPAQAITFGNINDKNSAVSKLKANERNYGMLSELNTRPRTTYLAKLLNPNPELAEPTFDSEYVPREGGHGGSGSHEREHV